MVRETYQFRGDVHRTGSDVPAHAELSQPGIRWEVNKRAAIRSSPLITDRFVVTGALDGYAYALRKNSGLLHWKAKLGEAILGSPTTYGSLCIFSGRNGIWAVDLSTGTLVWRVSTEQPVSSTPVHNGSLYFAGTWDGTLLAIDPEDSEILWTMSLPGRIWSSPAADAETVFVGTTTGDVFAIDTMSGRIQWSYSVERTFPEWGFTGSAIYSSPLIVEDTIFFGSADHSVYALDRASGTLRWEFETRGWVESSPAVGGEFILVGSNDHSLYALDTLDGTRIWSREFDGGIFGAPAVAGDRVYIGTLSGGIFVLDRATGKTVWSDSVYSTIKTSPAIGEEIVCIGDWTGTVYAFENQPRSTDTHSRQVNSETVSHTSDEARTWRIEAEQVISHTDNLMTLSWLDSNSDRERQPAVYTPKLPEYSDIDNTVFRTLMASLSGWDVIDSHPGVPRITSSGVNPYPWVQLENVPTTNLTQTTELPFPDRKRITIRIGDILSDIHEAGIAHGHVRPSVIQVTESTLEPAILGWGVDAVTVSLDPPNHSHHFLPPDHNPQSPMGLPATSADIYQYALLVTEYLFNASQENVLTAGLQRIDEHEDILKTLHNVLMNPPSNHSIRIVDIVDQLDGI